MPDSIIEGKKISCEIMVSFAWFFTANPNMLPRLNETAINMESVPKYFGRLDGRTALKRAGAVHNKMTDINKRWQNADNTIEISPKYNGTPFA